MPIQTERARSFSALHIKGRPLVLFNIWDAGSAKVVAKAGAKAIATGSWSVAAAHGYADGESMPLDALIANLERIVAAVDLPVSTDLEAGYGSTPEEVARTVTKAVASGAVGFNLEDQIIGAEGLYSVTEQSERIAAAREAANRAAIPVFINARTDVFLKAGPDRHDKSIMDEALQRADAYAKAGASGIFVPWLADETLIGRFCKACALPVNVMALPNTPPASRLAELGVARISHGPGPFRLAMQALESAARAAHS